MGLEWASPDPGLVLAIEVLDLVGAARDLTGKDLDEGIVDAGVRA
jgi:hypothetical protein